MKPESPSASRVWKSACQFHDLSQKQVLEEVAIRVGQVRKSAKDPSQKSHPLILLDLDSTLYEVGPRTYQILREWVASEESSPYPKLKRALAVLALEQVGYSIKNTLATLGLSLSDPEVERALPGLRNFWSARFFTSDYLKFDRAYPGAAEFSRRLHSLGAELIYLTGRDEPGMGEGTRANLIRDGFPWKETHLLLKSQAHLSDLTHKTEAARSIAQWGTLVASFENEPLNLVALYGVFPDAMHVFVDTVCSDREAMPCQGLYRIQGFV